MRHGGGGGIPFATSFPKRGARVFNSGNQNIPDAADTVLTFNTERWDYGNLWVVGSPTKLTLPVAGMWLVGGCVTFNTGTTGTRRLFVRKGGVDVIVKQHVEQAASYGILHVNTVWEFAANDYIELMVYSDVAAGTSDVVSDPKSGTEFWAQLIYPN